jgi:hypothetical protein
MPKPKKKLRRVEKLSFCPDCGKRFANETNVLRHLNQPSNACGTLLQARNSPLLQADEPRANTLTQAATGLLHSDLPFQSHSHPWPPNDDHLGDYDQNSADFDMDIDEEDLLPPRADSNEDSAQYVEYHPSTSHVFPGGKTFMDNFFSDANGSLRRANVFYPFASEEDWQLGSWLLRSGLSMAAIDKFLALNLVSAHFAISVDLS